MDCELLNLPLRHDRGFHPSPFDEEYAGTSPKIGKLSSDLNVSWGGVSTETAGWLAAEIWVICWILRKWVHKNFEAAGNIEYCILRHLVCHRDLWVLQNWQGWRQSVPLIDQIFLDFLSTGHLNKHFFIDPQVLRNIILPGLPGILV